RPTKPHPESAESLKPGQESVQGPILPSEEQGLAGLEDLEAWPPPSLCRFPGVQRLHPPLWRQSFRTLRYLRRNRIRRGTHRARGQCPRRRTACPEELWLLYLYIYCRRYLAIGPARYKTPLVHRLRGWRVLFLEALSK